MSMTDNVVVLRPQIGLARYDAVCRALAELKTIDEVKEVLDQTDAVRCYAHKAKNRTLEIDATEIRVKAERKLGELLTEQKDTVGLATGGDAMKARFPNGTEVRPTLAEMGIDKKLSSRVQKIAALPEGEFVTALDNWRDHTARHTARIKPLFQKSAVVPIKLRRPTLQYIQIMAAIEIRRIEIGLSMEQMSELMGTAERSYAKMLSPDTPSGRLVGWDTIELAFSVLWPEGSEIVVRPINGPAVVTAGARRKIRGEQAIWEQRQAARKAARKAVA